jgi:hypothetical protein
MRQQMSVKDRLAFPHAPATPMKNISTLWNHFRILISPERTRGVALLAAFP